MNKYARSNSAKSQLKKKRKIVSVVAVAHVWSSHNNTIITIADLYGDTLAASSGGVTQKGSRKSTPFAAQEAGKLVANKVKSMGVDELKVIIRGRGAGRDAAVKGLYAAGCKVLVIADKTKERFGGTRRRKKRRV